MKKLVSIIAMTAILLTFSIATSGCGGNRNQYFVETDEIKKVESNIKVDIKQLYVEKEPEFYKPSIYREKNELYPLEIKEYESSDVRVNIRSYGWSISESTKSNNATKLDSIITDKSKYLPNLEYGHKFDKNNNIIYYTKKDGTIESYKLTKEKEMDSWVAKLTYKNPQLCKRTLKNKLVAYGEREISIIDTQNPNDNVSIKIDDSNLYIIHIIPENDLLWIFCNDSTSLGITSDLGIKYCVFVVDMFVDNKPLKFSYNFVQTKCQDDSISLINEKELFTIDKNLNTQHHKLDELYGKVSIDYTFMTSRVVETDLFTVLKNNKRYPINLDNLPELIEIPMDLLNMNYNYSGSNWDYYYKKNGYIYGYDIYKQETTWKIKADNNYILPYYSTENGILSSNWYINEKKWVVTAYGEKK